MSGDASGIWPDALRAAAGVYLAPEDNLRITTIGALAGVVLAAEGRQVSPGGVTMAINERHVPSAVYGTVSTIVNTAEGMLTHFQLRATTGSALRGHVFAIVEVVRGSTANAQVLGTLLQGYVTATQRLAWPGSPIESSVAGVGRLRSIAGTDPAANVEISETVPAGVRWRILSFWFAFTTSVTVANRTPRIVIDDGATEYFRAGSGILQTASTTAVYEASAAPPIGAAGGGPNMIGLPYNIVLPAGHRIRTSTVSMDATDNYAAPQYVVEEWLEG
jgi:hypothetical protein